MAVLMRSGSKSLEWSGKKMLSAITSNWKLQMQLIASVSGLLTAVVTSDSGFAAAKSESAESLVRVSICSDN